MMLAGIMCLVVLCMIGSVKIKTEQHKNEPDRAYQLFQQGKLAAFRDQAQSCSTDQMDTLDIMYSKTVFFTSLGVTFRYWARSKCQGRCPKSSRTASSSGSATNKTICVLPVCHSVQSLRHCSSQNPCYSYCMPLIISLQCQASTGVVRSYHICFHFALLLSPVIALSTGSLTFGPG